MVLVGCQQLKQHTNQQPLKVVTSTNSVDGKTRIITCTRNYKLHNTPNHYNNNIQHYNNNPVSHNNCCHLTGYCCKGVNT